MKSNNYSLGGAEFIYKVIFFSLIFYLNNKDIFNQILLIIFNFINNNIYLLSNLKKMEILISKTKNIILVLYIYIIS